MFLLSWDLYVCPQTVAVMSACSRSSTLIRTVVFLSWCKLCFHSLPVAKLTEEGEKQKKKWTANIQRKRLLLWLLWLLWCAVTMVLSTPAILYQVAKSIPGFLQVGDILLLGLKACIGATQGLVGNVIVPYLASKMTRKKHVFTTVSTLLMNCVLPAFVIIYLDTGCLGRWVSLWTQCQSGSRYFHSRSGAAFVDTEHSVVPSVLLKSSDVCDQHVSWTSTSVSGCIHIALLRLQEVWMAKFITTGLVMPGLNLMRGKLPTESGAIVGNFGIYMAYVLVSSGHLPLMNIIVFLAFLGEGLVARVAWVQTCLKANYVKDVAATVVNTARLLSLMVHLASAAGDPQILVIASAYIFMLIMTKCICMRR